MLGAKYMVQSINPESIMALVVVAVVITGTAIGCAVVRVIRSFHH